MIEVVDYEEADSATHELAAGKALALYHSYVGLSEWAATNWPLADIWYTERNGDCIGLLVPKGTPTDCLPDWAKGYAILEWIHPDSDFGSGFRPAHPLRPQFTE